jgi:hypothetical protein
VHEIDALNQLLLHIVLFFLTSRALYRGRIWIPLAVISTDEGH